MYCRDHILYSLYLLHTHLPLVLQDHILYSFYLLQTHLTLVLQGPHIIQFLSLTHSFNPCATGTTYYTVYISYTLIYPLYYRDHIIYSFYLLQTHLALVLQGPHIIQFLSLTHSFNPCTARTKYYTVSISYTLIYPLYYRDHILYSFYLLHTHLTLVLQGPHIIKFLSLTHSFNPCTAGTTYYTVSISYTLI